MSNGSASPKDFVDIKLSLNLLPKLFDITENLEYDMFASVREYREQMEDYATMIENTIVDEPPIQLKEGGIIKEGVSGELDYFRDLLTGGEEWLKTFEEEEKERTGIKNLKIGYNRVLDTS